MSGDPDHKGLHISCHPFLQDGCRHTTGSSWLCALSLLCMLGLQHFLRLLYMQDLLCMLSLVSKVRLLSWLMLLCMLLPTGINAGT